MKYQKKWSEQILIEESLKKHNSESSEESSDKLNMLHVCISGIDLYHRAFTRGKYEGKDKLALMFDFIVLAGDMCPEGQFYEMEYTIGGTGAVYRALIQAVNPVTDIPLVIATLKGRNMLPNTFTPSRAWLREDIDAVCIGHCAKEDGDITFMHGIKEAKKDGRSIMQYCEEFHSACLEYYRGDVREVWADTKLSKASLEPVFICGSDNVNDPAFAARRYADMDELRFHINEASRIASDYNLNYFLVADTGEANTMQLRGNMTKEQMNHIVEAIYKNA